MARRATPRATRPRTRGYGIEQREDGLLPWDWATKRLERSRNYWVSTTRSDRRPHAMPVWGVWLEDTLFFGTDRISQKARNLANRPNVVVHLESGDEPVIIEGSVREVDDRELFRLIAEAYERKYPGAGPDPESELTTGAAWFEVVPRVAFGWREADFPQTATRWVFE